MNTKDCTICYQIACKKCDWVASDEEAGFVQKEILTSCPKCGWIPGDQIETASQLSDRIQINSEILIDLIY